MLYIVMYLIIIRPKADESVERQEWGAGPSHIRSSRPFYIIIRYYALITSVSIKNGDLLISLRISHHGRWWSAVLIPPKNISLLLSFIMMTEEFYFLVGINRAAGSAGTAMLDEDQESRRASSRGIIPRAKIKTVKMTFVIVFGKFY